jgi:hypothetical protein
MRPCLEVARFFGVDDGADPTVGLESIPPEDLSLEVLEARKMVSR